MQQFVKFLERGGKKPRITSDLKRLTEKNKKDRLEAFYFMSGLDSFFKVLYHFLHTNYCLGWDLALRIIDLVGDLMKSAFPLYKCHQYYDADFANTEATDEELEYDGE